MDLLQAALRLLAADAGFASDIEVKGRFPTPFKDENGAWRMPAGHRGEQLKMPKCTGDSDVEAWTASRFSIFAAYKIIHEARKLLGQAHNIDLTNSKLAAAAQLILDRRALLEANMSPDFSAPSTIAVAKAKLTKIQMAKKKNLKTIAKNVVEDTGCKHRNRNLCASKAIRWMLGTKYDPAAVTDERLREFVEAADPIYTSSGLARGERDSDREKHFTAIVKWMLKTHDAKFVIQSRTGEVPEGWFDLDVDVPAAEELIRSKLSKKALKHLNVLNKVKFNGSKLTYYTLALGLITYVKDALMSNGDVPITAVMGMCRHFGIRCPAGMAKVIRETLSKLGLILGNRTWGTDQCESFKIRAKALFLPFAMKMAIAEPMRAAYKAEVEAAFRHTNLSGSKTGAGLQADMVEVTLSSKRILNTTSATFSLCPTPEKFQTTISAFKDGAPSRNNVALGF
jgi:hypothetical protein